MSPPILLQLPTELLLAIVEQLPALPKDRRKELVKLTRVCRSLRPLAQELLQTKPLVHADKARGLVRAYFKHPVLAAKARTLELLSPKASFHIEKSKGDPPKTKIGRLPGMTKGETTLFQRSCSTLTTRLELPLPLELSLTADLARHEPNAYLALLLGMMPNLQELLLGSKQYQSGLGAFHPLFDGALHPTSEQTQTTYLGTILARLAPRLRRLELPAEYVFGIETDRLSAVFDLRRCSALTHVTLPQEALMQTNPAQGAMTPRPWEKLPTSLQGLTIAVDSCYALEALGDHLKPAKAILPKLSRIEIYANMQPPAKYNKDTYPLYYPADLQQRVATWVSAAEATGLCVVLRYSNLRHFHHMWKAVRKIGEGASYFTIVDRWWQGAVLTGCGRRETGAERRRKGRSWGGRGLWLGRGGRGIGGGGKGGRSRGRRRMIVTCLGIRIEWVGGCVGVVLASGVAALGCKVPRHGYSEEKGGSVRVS